MLARILDVVLWIAVVAIFVGAEMWATICDDDWPVAIIACIGGLVTMFLPLMAGTEKEGEGRM